jgi:chaperone BCS1
METLSYPFNSSMPTSTGLPVSAPMMLMLESTIPGFSIISGFLHSYLHIDLSQYLGALLLAAALATGGQYIYSQFRGTFDQYFTCCAEIKYNDEAYNYIMFWVSMNNMSKKSTRFIAGTQTNSNQVYSPDSDVEELPDDDEVEMTEATAMRLRNWDRMRPIRFTPSTGQHYFKYKGHWMTFHRSQEKDQGFYGVNKTDEISISCYGRNPQVLKDLLSEAQLAYLERDGNKTIIFRGIRGYGGSIDDMEWTRCMSRPPRSMSTVVLEDAQKQVIINDIKEYLRPRTKKWYSNRGIPYRRGYLLHGPPGTGKTSLCFALAGLLHLPIYVASLNSKNISEEGLASLFRDLPSRCIVLLEDIDSAGLTMKRSADVVSEEKTEEEKKDEKIPGPQGPQAPNAPPAVENKGISLSGFLNIIDGVASSEGRVLVMTTNHIEKLDAALLRPGRVDLTVHFGYATAAVLKGLFMAIYSSVEAEKEFASQSEKKKVAVNGSAAPVANGTLVVANTSPVSSTEKLATPKLSGRFLFSHGKSENEIEVLAEEFASKVPADVYSPAEIQGYLLRHKTDPDAAIQDVDGWLEANPKAKAASGETEAPKASS